MEKLTSFDEKR